MSDIYTRIQGNERLTGRMSGTASAAMGGSTRYDGGMPILIPQDYRGELLREHRTAVLPTAPEISEAGPTDAFPCLSEDTDDTHGTEESSDHPMLPTEDTDHGGSGSLLGGLYNLLIGESGAEEETLLLLAIGLLLLWGHLDRGGLFDRNTWDTDDLALLLIGYLLLS